MSLLREAIIRKIKRNGYEFKFAGYKVYIEHKDMMFIQVNLAYRGKQYHYKRNLKISIYDSIKIIKMAELLEDALLNEVWDSQ